MSKADEIVAKLTEAEGMDVYHALKAKFGWNGTVFQRADAEDRAGRELTEDEWNAIQASYPWRKGLSDILTERGWDLVDSALEDAGFENVGVDPEEDEG